MFIPDESIPVGQEDSAGGSEGSKILGSQVVRNLARTGMVNNTELSEQPSARRVCPKMPELQRLQG